jgi:putative flippase GtrA
LAEDRTLGSAAGVPGESPASDGSGRLAPDRAALQVPPAAGTHRTQTAGRWSGAARRPVAAALVRLFQPASLGRFAVVGVLNTATDFTIFATLHLAHGVAPVLANITGYCAGLAQSFALNRGWTFRTPAAAAIWSTFPRFAAVNLAGLAMTSACVWQLAGPVGAIPAKLIATVVSFFWGYFANRFYVFARRPPSARPYRRSGSGRQRE